jgi:hypothetical protein
MRRIPQGALFCVALLFSVCGEMPAQQVTNSSEEFRPEIGIFFGLKGTQRLYLLTRALVRESPHDNQLLFGAHFDVGLKPRIRIALEDIDASKREYLSFRFGYR